MFNAIMFGERLKKILKDKGLTQLWLSQQLNVYPSNVNSWVKGIAEPDIETIKKISKILDVPVDYLFGLIDFDEVEAYKKFFSKWRPLYEKVKAMADEKKYQVCSAPRGKLLFREAKDYILGPDAAILGFENQLESEVWFNNYIKGTITEFEYWSNLCDWMAQWKEKLERDIKK